MIVRASFHFLQLAFFVCIFIFRNENAALSQAHEYGLPVSGLGQYSAFRKVMLRNGFVPVPQAGHVDEFIEISCGNTVCSADWLGPDRIKSSFIIWFEYKGEKRMFYLAPQVE